MHILLVDDENTLLQSLSRFLTQTGYKIRQAANGIEALKQMNEAVPDLIISDIHMPEMNGIELLQTVRTRFPHVPMILMTGQGDANAVAALQHGALDYLKKPIKLTKLLQRIQRFEKRAELEANLLEETQELLLKEEVPAAAFQARNADDKILPLMQSGLEKVQYIEAFFQMHHEVLSKHLVPPPARENPTLAEAESLLSSLHEELEVVVNLLQDQ